MPAGPLPRRVALTRWGRRHLTAQAARSDGRLEELVVYRGGADPTSDTAQAAITTRLRNLMRTAGLDDPALRPGSVRLCLPAAAMADGGRLEDAARQLGLASLDIAAEVCDWDWQH